jgi:hypothetical protein
MIVARFEYRLTLPFSPDDLIKLEVLPAQPQLSIIAPDGSRTIWNEPGSMPEPTRVAGVNKKVAS